jgi:hypothetical protein
MRLLAAQSHPNVHFILKIAAFSHKTSIRRPASALAAKSLFYGSNRFVREPPVPLDPADPRSESLPCLSIVLGRTKTGSADEETHVPLIRPPVVALENWIGKAKIAKGAVFRAIDRWGCRTRL